MVLNVSRGGLFVQTGAGPQPGSRVSIDLDLASRSDAVSLGGRVVWRRVVASHLRTLSQGGIGVRIEAAAEAYYRFLSELAGGVPPSSRPSTPAGRASSAPRSPAEAPGREYRVRVKQDGGPRSRTLWVRSESEEEARGRALANVGAGWVILELEPSE
jgi:Tfp pilus assembly protein PilZ